MEEKEKNVTMPSFFQALLVIGATVLLIALGVFVYGVDVHIPIVLALAFAGAVGTFVLKRSWEDLAKGMERGVMVAMQGVFILLLVGILMGSWIKSGVVPSMIYYGLGILTPKFFLLASLLICSVVSLATGSSWGTSGTIGIALMGVAAGLGVPAPLAAGIVISGAYFGDKMSPFSDTTNMAPAVSGTTLYSHIKAMMVTTMPSYIIVCIISIVLGFKYGSGSLDVERIKAIQAIMGSEFYISPVTFIAPIVVIGLAFLKKPVLPGIFAGVLVGIVFCFVQGTTFGEIVSITHYGYKATFSASLGGAASLGDVSALLASHGIQGITPELAQEAGKMVSKLLSRGGLHSMMWTISLILIGLAFGGLLEECGFLEVILRKIASGVSSAFGLVAAVIGSCIAGNLLTGSQYLSIIMPGRMFRNAFKEKNLHPQMLSRSLEDSGTLTSVLIPWNVCGGYHASILGVATLTYAPFAFLCWITPLMALILTLLRIGVRYRKDGDSDIVGE